MRPAVFLDRDGVINANSPSYVLAWSDFHFLPGALEGLRQLAAADWPVVVVTNQSPIGRSKVTRADVDALNERMRREVAAAGGRIDAVYVCPHLPDEGCGCRKPRPGMLRQAAEELRLDLGASWMVGDHPTDAGAARAAGVRPILVRAGRATADELAADGAPITENLASAVAMILGQVSIAAYFPALSEVLQRIDAAAVERLVHAIRRARDRGGTIYTLGNGGSAATASHLALDLGKNTRRPETKPLRVFSLTDNVGLLTAWANDAHYEEVFSAQLQPLVRAEDLVVAVSGSGNSANVLNAVRVAREAGADTFGITGFSGGKLVTAAADCVIVPSDNMQLVEDGHMAIVHAAMCALRDEG